MLNFLFQVFTENTATPRGKYIQGISVLQLQPILSRIVALFSKFVLMIGVVLVFYKLPGILAEKISYRELKKRTIKQDLAEEE